MRGVLLCVLLAGLLHLLVLGGVSRLWPTVPGDVADEQTPSTFSTRSIRIENAAPAAATKTATALDKPPNQVLGSPQAAPVAPTPPSEPAPHAPESAAFVVPPPAEPARIAPMALAPVPAAILSAAPASAAAVPLTDAPATLQTHASAIALVAATPVTVPAPTLTPAPAIAVATAPIAPSVTTPSAPATAAAQHPPALASATSLAAAPAAPAVASAPTAPTAPAPTGAQVAYNYLFPASTRLKYDVAGIVKGFRYSVAGDLLWAHDGSNYTARLEISHFLLGSKVQTSKGAMTPRGLEPVRFGEKVRSEVAAHFERDKGKVSFSANTPDVPIMPLAQDQVSIFVQLAAMFAADGKTFVPGSKLVFQAVGARGSEDWEFRVQAPERLNIQGKDWAAYKLVREHRAEYDTRAELWLAPELEGMPIRIRLSQTSGDEIDMVWTRSQKP